MSAAELNQRILADLRTHHINPMNDVLFKFIFGKDERKQITLDFLNAVLEESLGHTIKDLTFRPTEQIPQSDDGKLTRLDVACELDTGEFIDVEVQVINYHNMQRRTLYYWSQLYLLGIVSGQDYAVLRPAITINILAFTLFAQTDPHAMYSIYNMKTGERLNRDMELHFLEIPKFVNKPVGEMTKMERWLAYFANQLNEQEKEELAMSEAAIRDAYAATGTFFKNPKETLRYVNRQMAIMDYNSSINAAEARGEKRGEARGEKRGEARGEKRGEERMANLMQRLYAEGRNDDAIKAASDKTYRQKLYQELHI